jgi:hypothetical protein
MTTKWTQGEDDSLAFLHNNVNRAPTANVMWRVISDVLNNWHHANRSARSCEARWQRIQQEAAQ